jgi:pilus assembly protein Flp/PilA
MKNFMTRFVDDQSGASAVEYTLLGVMIALAIIVGMQNFGSALNGEFNVIARDL